MHWNKTVCQRPSDALTRVSWQDFERLLADWYADQGYRVEHVGTAGSGARFDGGIDLRTNGSSFPGALACMFDHA